MTNASAYLNFALFFALSVANRLYFLLDTSWIKFWTMRIVYLGLTKCVRPHCCLIEVLCLGICDTRLIPYLLFQIATNKFCGFFVFNLFPKSVSPHGLKCGVALKRMVLGASVSTFAILSNQIGLQTPDGISWAAWESVCLFNFHLWSYLMITFPALTSQLGTHSKTALCAICGYNCSICRPDLFPLTTWVKMMVIILNLHRMHTHTHTHVQFFSTLPLLWSRPHHLCWDVSGGLLQPL